MTEWPDYIAPANGLAIHYYRTGNGELPPLFLLHGVMDDGSGWIPVARDLQARFDIIMPDARGHGSTEGPLEDFSYALLAADVVALMETLQLEEQAYLFGHSMGGLTAAWVAAEYPALARAVVLEDPPLNAPKAFQEEGEQNQDQAGQFISMVQVLGTLPVEQRMAIARQYNPLWAEEELAPWIGSKLAFNPEVLHKLKFRPAWREIMARITCPVLLVTGDPDAHAIVTPQIAQEVMELLPHGELIQIPGAGHCIHRDCYSETMPQIQAFLERV